MDLSLLGGVSSWSNNISWSRLDRFLVSLEWDLSYPDMLQKNLTHMCLDHAPILLLGVVGRMGSALLSLKICG
jgi:endonuclease/exonuclease/phosphatase family metal-dependent hydrolase